MRDIEASGWMVRSMPDVLTRGLRFAAVALGIGLVMAVGAARAQDDDEDDNKTFEEKIIDNIMTGLGGTNMDNRGIDYRERSPLVVPPRLDLPPPQSVRSEIKDPNWPKDPDEQRRLADIQARKKRVKDDSQTTRVLSPSELNVGRVTPSKRASSDPLTPGDSVAHPILSPSQLGYNGGFMGMFHGNQAETAPFKGEPERDSLTQPPPGYQTPSPNFAYGTGPKESLNKQYNTPASIGPTGNTDK